MVKLVVFPKAETLFLEPIFISELELITLNYFPENYLTNFDTTLFITNRNVDLLALIKWINGNLNNIVWLRYSLGFGFRLLFSNDEDAMYFKLTWTNFINGN